MADIILTTSLILYRSNVGDGTIYPVCLKAQRVLWFYHQQTFFQTQSTITNWMIKHKDDVSELLSRILYEKYWWWWIRNNFFFQRVVSPPAYLFVTFFQTECCCRPRYLWLFTSKEAVITLIGSLLWGTFNMVEPNRSTADLAKIYIHQRETFTASTDSRWDKRSYLANKWKARFVCISAMLFISFIFLEYPWG